MHRSCDYSRLCRLIVDSIRPYTESEVFSLTKDKEKDLLLVLSQVLREIQLLKHDCNSENDTVVNPACKSKCSGGWNSRSEDDCCLAKIISDFIVLLTVESQYVQHLAGNVLVVISEFVAASGINWNKFIHVLCVCLQLAISNTLSYSLEPSTTGAEKSNSNSSSFVIVLKPKLKIANWSTMAGIIRVLRNILKYLKQEYDNQLVEAYLDSVSSCLSNVPWDFLNEIHVGQNGDAQRSTVANALLHRNVWRSESRTEFLGNLVQLFCSLVDQSGLVEAAGGSPDAHLILCTIRNLTPGLLYWCLGKHGDCSDTSISQYFRHKLLDDILFEVLLQLFSVPFCAEQQCFKEKRTFQELKEDILFHVSNLFNPLHLFHLFLAELYYDHQVLLDYLISKDTGINCAEYLLRCLRTVCDSWHLFVEFSVSGKALNQSSCKKRKVFSDGPNSQVEQSSALEKGNALSLEEVYVRDHRYGSKHYVSRGWPFKEAKDCLLSLKSSMESLHQKNLFPYNPKVLLRRLMRFQDLCLKQESYVQRMEEPIRNSSPINPG